MHRKIQEKRLRWYGHIQRREEFVTKRVLTLSILFTSPIVVTSETMQLLYDVNIYMISYNYKNLYFSSILHHKIIFYIYSLTINL
jgi:hypothetical protein